MERRSALILLGAVAAGVFGTRVEAADEERLISKQARTITLNENGLDEFIIIRKDGTEIIVPFSEIIDALVKK